MKKSRIIALFLLVAVLFTSCDINLKVPGIGGDGDKPSDDSGKTQTPETPSQPAADYINDNITFDVGERVYIIVGISMSDSTKVNTYNLETIICDATGVYGRIMTDEGEEMPNEITLGICNREVAKLGYDRLGDIEKAHSKVARYGFYVTENAVAIVYDLVEGYEKKIINMAVEFFENECIKYDTAVNLSPNLFRYKTIDLIEYQAAEDAERIEQAWEIFEKQAGKEAHAALKEMYESFYHRDKLVEWFANLFDPATGGFYYSNSARDNDRVLHNGKYYPLLPDIESTSQATGFIASSGMTYGYSSLKDALPDWMRLSIIKFIKEKQDPNGYFYHPQWTHEMVDNALSRRARDMTKGLGTLRDLGARPTYDTPTGMGGDGKLWNGTPISAASKLTTPLSGSSVAAVSRVVATAVAVPSHLVDDVAFKNYLAGLDINGRSYWVGNQIASQTSEIKARDKVLKEKGADYSLVEILVEWLDDHCYETTGHWKKVADYDGLNGLMKISAAYESLEAPLPYPVQASKSAIATITMEDDINGSTVCFIYNSWFAINNIIGNVRTHKSMAEADEIVGNIRKTLRDNAPELIRATAAKQGKFMCDDGSFSYTVACSSSTSQGMPVAIPGTKEGDVNATVICTTGTISNMMNALGYDSIPLLTPSDFNKYLAVIEENKAKLGADYNYAETEKDLVSDKINFKLSTHKNTSTGVTAPVIKIYNSTLYTTEAEQRSILEYIISSDVGVEAGLLKSDIDYYIKEWKMHNYAAKYPGWVASLLDKTRDEVIKSAEHADLNTNDEHASVYESFASMLDTAE
ncbi:MAG: hypothetical protein J6D20_08110 [Clostridia bacterium]|nr:hypothetical protein [Clostridia bacterium]